MFPDSVTSIGRCAFANCIRLTDITLPNGITCIEDNTFFGCKSLKSIIIPDSVTIIEIFAFAHCEDLEKILIPPSVQKMDEDVFLSSKLTTIFSTTGSCATKYAIRNNIKLRIIKS